MAYNPTSYSSTKLKKKKPKLSFGTGFAAPAPKAKAPVAKAPSGAPVNGPPPAGILGPAPPTLQGESNRIDAGENYGLAQTGINQQLMQAAMRYGGAPMVQQFGFNPNGSDSSTMVGITGSPDDNSTLSTIARQAKLAATGIDQGQNSQNTFFSGNRLNALQTNQDDAARARATAKAEYDAAVSELVNQLLGARSTRDSAKRNADIGDINYAASQEPEAAVPQSNAPPPKKAAPKKKPTLKKKPKPKGKKK